MTERPRIFVNIASFRDRECQHTIQDLFAKAAHPERIQVGVCWQVDAAEDGNCFTLPYSYPAQVKEIRVEYQNSRGAVWARAEAQKLCADAEYTLQIDSHMRFIPGWDEKLITQLAHCPAEKPVISAFLPGYTPPDQWQQTDEISYMHAAGFAHWPVPQVHIHGGLAPRSDWNSNPFPTPFVVGNFIFAKTSAFTEVPLDPHIFFKGYEISQSARFFTHGYDVFQPTENLAAHRWVLDETTLQNQTYKNLVATQNRLSFERVNHLLGIEAVRDKAALENLDHYGLGTVRTLQEFWNYAGVNLGTRRLRSHAAEGKWSRVPAAPSPRNPKTIFIAIAAFRDTEVQHTVADAFAKAAHPDRIHIGICWQYDKTEDADCFTHPSPRPNQTREKHFHYTESKGAGWARAEAMKLYEAEDYVLQIDGHMRFAPGWDTALMDMLEACPAEKPVLTALLPTYTPPDNLQDCMGLLSYITVSAMGQGTDPQLVHLAGGLRSNKHQSGIPFPSAFVVGNFIFGRAATWAEVPIDPHVSFYGEEINYSARLWTHGYDIFQPPRVVIWHQWDRSATVKKQTYRSQSAEHNTRSRARNMHLFGLEYTKDTGILAEIEKYPLGTQRRLADYWEFADIDLTARFAGARAKNGAWLMQRDIREYLPHVSQTPAEIAAKQRIFVQIASYRDRECQWTVKDLFDKAAHPDRVFVGICWQAVPEIDDDCFLFETRPAQVRVTRVDAKDSKGVCWARAETQKLWRGEEFTLQIDSHMRFAPGWDELLIAELAQCPSPKAVLSCYPCAYTPPNNLDPAPRHSVMTAQRFDENGEVRFKGDFLDTEPPRPLRGAFLAAGFIFARGDIIRDVPYDPYLYFNLEEISLAARLFTHGYDLYSAHTPIIYHFYNDGSAAVNDRPLHWSDNKNWEDLHHLSRARFHHLFGMEKTDNPAALADLDRYGFGTARSLRAFEEFTGIYFASRSVTDRAFHGLFIEDIEKYRQLPAPTSAPQATQEPAVPGSKNLLLQQVPFLKMQAETQYGNVTFSYEPSPTPQEAPMASPAILHTHKARKIMETEHCMVFDDFLPEDIFDQIYEFSCTSDYEHINSQGKVARAWRIRDGFPLRSSLNLFYFANNAERPNEAWAYPTNTALDRFADYLNGINPHVKHLVGAPGKDWDRFSITSWLYPTGTALSVHDDGAGVYSGAYAFFINPYWDIHWGGLLLMADPNGSKAVQKFKKTVDPMDHYRKKWFDPSDETGPLWDPGLATCIFPKRNRIVFIHNEAYHLVTKVLPDAGDNVRQSLAGFFHKPKPGVGGEY